MTGKKGFTLILTILMLPVFMIPGNGIAETAEPTWDFEADVVVVGAGGAGLPAALKALEDGSSDNGMGGAVRVMVITFGGEIVNIKVTEQNETFGIGDVALEQFVAQAKEKKSADVDTVTGATITSKAFIEALTNALEKIGK